jgi:chitinase
MKTSLHRARFAPPLALALILGITGCSGEDPGDDEASSSGSPQGSGSGQPSGGNSGSGGSSSSSGAGAGSGTGGSMVGPSDKRIIGYFPAWGIYERDFNIADIHADKLTHINYAFANVVGGECALGDPWADVEKPMGDDTADTPLRGNFHQLQILKEAHPGLKTLISVGGWTWSSGFSALAMTAESRAKFATSCVKFMKDYGFDGIDIDWEYPVGGGLDIGAPEDKQNFTLLLQELRTTLDSQGAADGDAHYLLSIAAPAGPAIIANLEVGEIHAALDFINVMTYDFHGTWEATTNFNAPLFLSSTDPSPADVRASFNVDAAVEAYLAAGVPADKVVMGMAFYGRGWAGVGPAGDGLYQQSSGAAQGKFAAGSFDYGELDAYLATYTRHWHDEAKVPWLYDPATGIMISYDDPESIGLKADYVNERGLGGAMIWELSGDDDAGSLLEAARARLAP